MPSESEFKEQQARLDSLRAFVAEKEEGISSALEVLRTGDDPIRFRTRLATLVRNNEFQTAFSLIEEEPLHEKWGDLAVYACVAVEGEDLAVKKLQESSKSFGPSTTDKFRLAFAEAAMMERLNHLLNPTIAQIGILDSKDQTLLERVVDVLWPIANRVRANESIQSKIQEFAIYWLSNCLGLLGRLTELVGLVSPLLRYKPIPLVLAQLARSGALDPVPAELVARIRTEHPTNFDAQLHAIICEFELFGRFENAMNGLKRIKLQFSNLNTEDRTRFCELLFEVSSRLGGDSIEEARELVRDLLGEQNQFELYLDAIKLIEGKDFNGALSFLQDNERIDETLWWQILAKCHEQLGDVGEAAKAMEQACELMPHPSMLNDFAGLSMSQKDRSAAIAALERALVVAPRDIKTISRLASICVDVRDNRRAAELFSLLSEIEEDNFLHQLNSAICLARSSQLEKALVTLDSIGEPEASNLQVVLTRCQILRSAGQLEPAFELASKKKEEFWDDASFVMTLMDLAYRTQKSDSANAAMQRLLELGKSNGDSEPKFLAQYSLDQFLEDSKQRRKHMDEVAEMVTAGKMPWLYADTMFGLTILKSWHSRTAKLNWVSEERSVRGQSTVYSTNHFAVLANQEGKSGIEKIEAVGEDTPVMADISALITLSQIGKLDEAFDYFGKIVIPGSIEELRVEETTSHHQPEQEEYLKQIKSAIDDQKIQISDAQDLLPILDEYSEDETTVFRFANLIDALESTGKFTTENIADVTRLSLKEKGNGSLDISQPFQVELTTLGSLAKLSWFARLLEHTDVLISNNNNQRLIGELAGHEEIHRINALTKQFWGHLEKHSDKLVTTGVHFDDEGGEEFRTIPHLDATLVATEKKLPLLADDRACQQIRFFDTATRSSAFGTDVLLDRLFETNRISIEQATDDYLKLMKWRYRFLVPKAVYLKNLADRSRKNLPGPDLMDVAKYIHDCMQDPGLLCGIENSEPPMPLAFKLNFAWVTTVIEFIRLLAEDDDYDPETLKVLVRWVIKSMIPSTPNYLLHHQVGKNITSAISSTIVKLTLSSLIAIESLERANLVARLVAKALPMTPTEFYLHAAEAAHERSF